MLLMKDLMRREEEIVREVGNGVRNGIHYEKTTGGENEWERGQQWMWMKAGHSMCDDSMMRPISVYANIEIIKSKKATKLRPTDGLVRKLTWSTHIWYETWWPKVDTYNPKQAKWAKPVLHTHKHPYIHTYIHISICICLCTLLISKNWN